jgi:hypothetical protein
VAPGINVLSANIQCLNLHYANISRKAIKKLAHLTALRQLNMSHCKEMTAALLKVPCTLSFFSTLFQAKIVLILNRPLLCGLQYVPDTVEELDLSYCPKLEFEGRTKYTVYLSLMWHHTALACKWPSGLRSLKLTGIKSATAALFSTQEMITHSKARTRGLTTRDVRTVVCVSRSSAHCARA